jgi:hypothetical protein
MVQSTLLPPNAEYIPYPRHRESASEMMRGGEQFIKSLLDTQTGKLARIAMK